MTLTRAGAALAVWALALGSGAAANAQSTLSTQGLGYPPGQLSTQAKSMGGSIGEADPLSPLNPASIGVLSSAIIMFQAEPEYRTLTIGGRTQRTSVSRFPLFLGALPLGTKWAIAVTASTLLDRTWETTTRDSQFVGPDTVRFDRTQSSDGSIADNRFAVSYAPTSWLKVGLGLHALSGRALLFRELAFDDSSFARDVEQTTISFAGNALSVGAHAAKSRLGAVGVSYRRGGRFSLLEADNTLGRSFAPDHFGVSVIYLGLTGAAFAVRASKDGWSQLEGTMESLSIHEGWDVGVGADVTGPAFGGSPMSLRAGGRWRTLPFSADSTAVKERTWSAGFGIPMARGDVELNFGVIRASRRGSAGVSESAWAFSTGFAIRP